MDGQDGTRAGGTMGGTEVASGRREDSTCGGDVKTRAPYCGCDL